MKSTVYLMLAAVLVFGGCDSNDDADTIHHGSIYIYDGNYESIRQELLGIKRISGNLRIENSDLENLAVLDQIEQIGGTFELYGNDKLVSTQGMTSLKKVGGLHFARNPVLERIEGFELIPLNGLSIFGSPVKYINQFEAVDSLDVLSLGDLPYLENVHLFPALEQVTSAFGLSWLPLMKSFYFPKLESLHGYINISYNDALENLSGFPELKSASGGLRITDNNLLSSFIGLDHVSIRVTYNVLIVDNINLQSLEGLHLNYDPGIDTEDLSIGVFGNEQLQDFCALKPFWQAAQDQIWFSVFDNLVNPGKDEIIANCP